MRGAFVVQLKTRSKGDQVEGSVEEVDTGKHLHFSSKEELIVFLCERFAETCGSVPGSEGKMTSVRLASDPAARLSPVVSTVHDLRNPLATIHGGAEILVTSQLSQAQVNRIARNIYCASFRMRELLEEFLDQSRDQTRGMERELIDVHELVTMAVDRIAVTAELQAVHIVRAVPEGLSIFLDRHRIHRVLVNLLVNALEAMPHGGSIHISTVTDRHSVIIRVRDSGPGIAPEIRDRLFQPFATAGKANGTGLGLASSRQAVLDHGGEMWAESSLEGTCFAVRLPLGREPRPSQSDAPHPVMNWNDRTIQQESAFR